MGQRNKKEIPEEKLEFAKYLRENRTGSEKKLWRVLRGKKLGVKFRQQYILKGFIADFVCLNPMLVIEVDGSVHNDTQEYDQKRQKVLEDLGFMVIRFTNEDVINNFEYVIGRIKEAIQVAPISDSYQKKLDIEKRKEERRKEKEFKEMNRERLKEETREWRKANGYDWHIK